jgi:hypothetical protein
MTVEQLTKLRRDLECNIVEKLREFRAATGLCVHAVDLKLATTSYCGQVTTQVVGASVEVRF